MGHSLLILDDEAVLREDLAMLLRRRGFDVQTCGDVTTGIAVAQDTQPDAVLCDLVMPGGGAMTLLQALRNQPNTGVFLMTAYGSLDSAIHAFRAGAVDYILKPLDLDDLYHKLSRYCATQEVRKRHHDLRKELGTPSGGEELVGSSAHCVAVKDLIQRIAQTRATVLLTGETGTGKDVVARSIHAQSPWKKEDFVAINCAAFPESLLESELFGHVRGAFTGAVRDKIGLFEAANGGTLFLDEIAETSPTVQAKLLRAVERHIVTPVGATQPRSVEFRLIAATNKKIEDLVKTGRFREDLMYRLRVIEIELPPLRKRREDIPPLCAHFLAQFRAQIGSQISSVEPRALRALMAYDWPGNVRELRNVLERAAILCEGSEIQLSDLPQILAGGANEPREEDNLRSTVRNFERDHIRRVLDECGGDKEAAARRLGVDLSTLYRKLSGGTP